MSFRKRNIVVISPGSTPSLSAAKSTATSIQPGVRPSPLDGRLTISTGTRSLDTLLAGHAGLALGSSILLEESGATDFGGALLRYYAAEGIVQGHCVHVLGPSEAWARELPGLSATGDRPARDSSVKSGSEDKMKIAWRYERLGEFGRDKGSPPSSSSEDAAKAVVFCHDFDLSKRLALPSPTLLKCVPVATQRSLAFGATETSVDPFAGFLRHIIAQLATSSPTAIHRVVIPSILSPAMYPHTASTPEHILRFFQSIRALLRKHPTQLTVLITLPLSLYPRVNGLTRWMELLSDGVLEFAPFPSNSSPAAMLHSSGTATSRDEPPQGMLKVHRLPIFHEKGGGGGESSGVGDDLAFSLSRRKGLVIKPFSLPPVEGDAEAQEGVTTNNGEKATKLDIEF